MLTGGCSGETALHKAARYQRRQICSLLVTAGASASKTDSQVRLGLLLCCSHLGYNCLETRFDNQVFFGQILLLLSYFLTSVFIKLIITYYGWFSKY